MTSMTKTITVVAPVNIAVIKYWGKRDEDLIIPLNDSVSGTLDVNVMCAETSVCASADFTKNRIWLNDKEETFETKRIMNCLQELKKRAMEEKSIEEKILQWNIYVYSKNNFPTAAGLASSAAGFACLVSAIAKLYNIKSNISSIARLGSGSACRSVFGGFVQWHAGQLSDGSDSYATQIVGPEHWPQMRVLILVANDKQKKVSSTRGMFDSVKTSELLKYRVTECVPKRTKEIIEAIKNKDFEKFAEITMKESNQFHAICLDTFPPCIYMNETSYKIIDIIEKYNNIEGSLKVAYTFDAGPNACLYLLESEVSKVLSIIRYVFPSEDENFVSGLPAPNENIDNELIAKMSLQKESKNLLKNVIYTKIGEGPSIKESKNPFPNLEGIL